jgi:hypothetical protein
MNKRETARLGGVMINKDTAGGVFNLEKKGNNLTGVILSSGST